MIESVAIAANNAQQNNTALLFLLVLMISVLALEFVSYHWTRVISKVDTIVHYAIIVLGCTMFTRIVSLLMQGQEPNPIAASRPYQNGSGILVLCTIMGMLFMIRVVKLLIGGTNVRRRPYVDKSKAASRRNRSFQ